jgi:hypothetical protein
MRASRPLRRPGRLPTAPHPNLCIPEDALINYSEEHA